MDALRKRLAQAAAADDESFEAWQFNNSRGLHIIIFVWAFMWRVGLTIAGTAKATEESTGGVFNLGIIHTINGFFAFMMILLRVAALFVIDKAWRRFMRRLWCGLALLYFHIVLMVLTARVALLDVVTPSSFPSSRSSSVQTIPSLMIMYVLAPTLMFISGLLGASCWNSRPLYVLLHTILFMPYLVLVVVKSVQLGATLFTEWNITVDGVLLAGALFAVWIASLGVFFQLEGMGRAQYRSMQQIRGLAAAKSRYVAALSHDFGAPITMIHMLLERLERDPVTVTQVGAHTLKGLHAALELLSTIRTKAMNLNKLEHDQRLQPERSSLHMRKLLDDVMLVAEHLPKRSGVTFELHVADEAFPAHERVISDRGWLFVILINLLSNAFKNTREGSVRLTVSVEDDKGPHGAMVRARVADTGTGVPAELEPHLFCSYQQASKWRFGTGLGLYHVRELATALGGTVGYERNTPAGAIFDVHLPLVLAEGASPGDSPQDSFGASKSSATSDDALQLHPASVTVLVGATPRASAQLDDEQGGTQTPEEATQAAADAPQPADAPDAQAGALPFSVLLVDDDDFVREATRLVLEGAIEGGRIEEAADGEEGLLKFKRAGPFDLVLLDAQMPFMDGLECMRRLRAWEQTGERPAGDGPTRVRAIAVSGNADDPGFYHEAMTAGFDDAIAKPLTHARAQAMLAIGER